MNPAQILDKLSLIHSSEWGQPKVGVCKSCARHDLSLTVKDQCETCRFLEAVVDPTGQARFSGCMIITEKGVDMWCMAAQYSRPPSYRGKDVRLVYSDREKISDNKKVTDKLLFLPKAFKAALATQGNFIFVVKMNTKTTLTLADLVVNDSSERELIRISGPGEPLKKPHNGRIVFRSRIRDIEEGGDHTQPSFFFHRVLTGDYKTWYL